MADTITFPSGPLPPEYYTEDRGAVLISVAITFIVLELVAFGLRAIARRLKRVPFGWDDCFIITALALCLTLDIMSILAVPYAGVGRHTLVIAMESPKKLSFMGKNALIISPILWQSAINVAKGAILQLYLRIFTSKTTRYLTYAVGAILIMQGIAYLFVSIFQCNPISLVWTSIVRNTCIDTKTFWVYNSVPSFLTDVAILVLPFPTIWKLKTTTHIKIGLTMTFLTASIGIAASVLRFIGFFESPVFSDPCWAAVDLTSYGLAEPGAYFLAACFPSYRPLLSYVLSIDFRSSFAVSSWISSKKYGTMTDGKEDGTQSREDQVNLRDPNGLAAVESIRLDEIGESHKGSHQDDGPYSSWGVLEN
ncbi:hypothetical protein B7494_g685 [Chlorociboria aeruginascens]|nr:hypothetical protein B7494_g685 [Chlorociboria aeruginascens]